jgi:hypothetical protein
MFAIALSSLHDFIILWSCQIYRRLATAIFLVQSEQPSAVRTTFKLKGIQKMRKYLLVSTALVMFGLSACDRPTVIVPAVPAAVPGPAGPAGATGSQGNDGSKGATGMQGNQGNQGNDGTKGDTGKTGTGGAAIVIVPAETPPAK